MLKKHYNKFLDIDNCAYFPELVDVRLNYRAGSSTIKELSKRLRKASPAGNDINKYTNRYLQNGSYPFRFHLMRRFADDMDYPYRYGSIRMTTKRDPVDRFTSTVMFLNQGTYSDVLDHIENNIKVDPHLWTQTRYLGNKSKYDYVYDLTDIQTMIQHIWELHTPCNNISLDIHMNKGVEDKPEPTEDEIRRIQQIYAVDYENGWC